MSFSETYTEEEMADEESFIEWADVQASAIEQPETGDRWPTPAEARQQLGGSAYNDWLLFEFGNGVED